MAGLADHGVVLIRADNPSPLTLTGTNTWFVAGWVIDHYNEHTTQVTAMLRDLPGAD